MRISTKRNYKKETNFGAEKYHNKVEKFTRLAQAE